MGGNVMEGWVIDYKSCDGVTPCLHLTHRIVMFPASFIALEGVDAGSV